MKKLALITFIIFNIYTFKTNAVIEFTQEQIQKEQDPFKCPSLIDLFDRYHKKSISSIFKKQNKEIAHNEDLSLEEKMDVLNVFFASVEISDEDKDYLTKEMLAGDFSLLKNLTILDNFERKKSQIEFEANKDFFSQPLQLQSKEAITCQLVEADINEEGRDFYYYYRRNYVILPNILYKYRTKKSLLIGE
ncbi:MAG: hypothetical protein Q8L85_08975 [Alphaproteobacteria bacterium]|nr:hypothetical protein [Alphaproteobacteria bacterium]